MKIMKTVPQNGDIYSHEAPTAKVLMGLTWFFLLVSTATVTASWEVFLGDRLAPLGGWKWPIVVIWGALFCLPVNVLILELSKYFWRSIIKGYWKGSHTFQFVIATLLLAAGLFYSIYMSQKATKAAMVSAAPKEQVVDTEEIDLAYRKQMGLAASTYSDNEQATGDRYAALEKAVSKKYATLLDSLQSEYAILAAKKSNARNTTRLNSLSRKMVAAESAKAGELSDLATAKANEIAGYQSEKLSAEKSAKGQRETNLEILTKETEEGNGDTSEFAKTFSTLISIVAAVADLFVFLLACFVELFYHRTGVKRLVFAENSDITGGVLLEIIRYPFVAITRRASVWVSKKYAALPEPIAPRAPEDLFDPSEFTSKILSVATTTPEPEAKAPAKPATKEPAKEKHLAPPPHLADKGYLMPIAYTGIVGQTPPPAAPLSGLEPFSLKESKPAKESAKEEAAKLSRGIPDELEDIIKKAFKNPAKLPGFYEVIGFSPADFSTAFDYLERLKKTARNCNVAAKNPKGSDTTRALNSKRLRFITAELCRMSVEVYPADGGVKFRWILDPARREGWEKMV